jgi:hypothetical protein
MIRLMKVNLGWAQGESPLRLHWQLSSVWWVAAERFWYLKSGCFSLGADEKTRCKTVQLELIFDAHADIRNDRQATK